MKVAVVFILLFATVLCRPAKKPSESSESSEEVVRRPAPQAIKKKVPVAPKVQAPRVQNVVAAVAAAVGSDESNDNSEEEEQAAPEAPVEVKSGSIVAASDSTLDTASVKGTDSDSHGDDDDENEDETEEEKEEEEEEEEEESSAESGESSTPAPTNIIPVVITDQPGIETTAEPIVPTIVTDTDASRGDSLGGPSDYKSIIYVEDKSYHKVPVPYKSYEFVGKKMAYDMTNGNEVEKSVKVHKALQVHSDVLEEDTSTSEVENQALDASSGTLSQDPSFRQAAVPEEEGASASEASTSDTTSESSSTPEEEEENEENASTDSSTSQEAEDEEESQSSEETTATPGAADSDSDESDSDENDSDKEEAGPDTTTDMPVVITAK